MELKDLEKYTIIYKYIYIYYFIFHQSNNIVMYKYLYYLLIIVGQIITYIIYNCFLSENFTTINNTPLEVWGIDTDNQIWKAPLPCDKDKCNWSYVNGRLKHISQGENDLWGTTITNSIWRCSKPCNGKWIRIPGSFTQVSVGKNSVWGIDNNNIKYCNNTKNSPCTGDWIIADKPVQSKNIIIPSSTDTTDTKDTTNTREVWAVDYINSIWKAPLPCENGKCNWTNVNGAFKQISQGEHDIWGILPNNSIRRCSKPCNGGSEWEKVEGTLLNQISVGKNTVWGVDNNNNIKYCNNTKDSPCDGDWLTTNNPVIIPKLPTTKSSKNYVFMPEDSTTYLAKKDVVIKEVSVNNT